MVIAVTVTVLILLILLVTYVFLIMPRATFAADMELLSTDYARGGLSSEGMASNSLRSFALAVREGYGIEFELSMSADGVLVAFREDGFLRGRIKRKVSKMSLAELKGIRLSKDGDTVATLKEVLDLVDGGVPLLINVGTGKERLILCEKMAAMLDNYTGAYCVESEDPRVLRWFRDHRPRYARGQIVGTGNQVKKELGALRAFFVSTMLSNVFTRPDFISINGREMKKAAFVIATKIFRAKGFVFTVRSERVHRLVRSKGYFAIFEKIRP